jgi:intracellular sulfur oxidation DsrE/DsrF family protein
VSNAATVAAWDGVDTATAGDDAGEVTVVCYGLGGQVDSGVRAELAAQMQTITAAGVTVHVNPATLVEVDVTVSVIADSGFDVADVQAGVVVALTSYLNPATWEFGATVRRTALIAVIAAVPGVASLSTPTAPASDETTLDVDEVATVGTLTVSVT